MKTASWSIHDVLGWWFGQLARLVPARIARAFVPPRRWLVVDLAAAPPALIRRSGALETPLAVAPTDDVARLDEILPTHARRGAGVIVRLPAAAGVRRHVVLPRAAEQNLDQVLRFEIDRLTPFPPDAVAFAGAVAERGPDSIRVRVEAIPVAVLRGLEQRAGVWGLRLVAVELDGAEPPLDVYGDPKRTGALSFAGRVNLVLLAACFCLAAALATQVLLRDRATLARLEAALAEAAARSAPADRLRSELQTGIVQSGFLADRRPDPPLAQILDELAALLPDDTWVQELSFEDGQLRVRGLTERASELLPLVEAHPRFADVRLLSPVTRDERLGRERLHLGFRIAAEGRG